MGTCSGSLCVMTIMSVLWTRIWTLWMFCMRFVFVLVRGDELLSAPSPGEDGHESGRTVDGRG